MQPRHVKVAINYKTIEVQIFESVCVCANIAVKVQIEIKA